MRAVVSQVHARCVQGQRITRHSAIHRTDDGGTRCRGVAVIHLGERTANAGCGTQGFGGDGACDIGNDRRGEAVVAGHAVASGRGNGQRTKTEGHDLVGLGDVCIVVDQGNARGVQTQRVAIHCAVHHACHSSTRGRRGAVIDLGERATDAGRGGEGLRRDGSCSICNGGRGEAVVTGQGVGRGRVDGQRGGTTGRQRRGTGHMGTVVGDCQTCGVQAHAIPGNRTCHGSAYRGRRGRGPVVGFGQGPANARRGRQGFGCDGGRGIRNGGRGEAVITGQAAGTGRNDREFAVSCCHDGVGGNHVSIVVGQGDTRRVQAQAVARYSTGDRTGDGGARGGGAAVVGFGEAAANAGRGSQRFGDDGCRHVCDHRRGEAVV